MRDSRRWLAGGLAVALVLVALGGQGSLAAGDRIYVNALAVGDNDGSSWEDAYTNLQTALDAAVAGDEIWVAEGIYRPTVANGGTGERYRSYQLKSGVVLYGGFAGSESTLAERDWVLHETILSGDLKGDDGPDFANNGENSYHVLYHQGTSPDSSAILDGFTISGGNANGTAAQLRGGGMYNLRSSPTLRHCAFKGNWAESGGAIYNNDCSPSLTDCTFEGNQASSAGGAIYNDKAAPTLTNCTFEGNSTGSEGGGIYNNEANPTLTGCVFTGNSAGTNGGGMLNNGSSPALAGCLFEGNSASYGGGMHNTYSSVPTLSGCTFSGNDALYGGGGMYNYSASSPTLTNCTFAANSTGGAGGAMRNYLSSPTLTNCTFSGNSSVGDGGGIYNRSASPTVTNCILWGDTPGEIFNWDEASAPVVTYSDVQGGYEGEGNLDAYPWLVDAANGDLHLGACSPCIDAGNNIAPALPALDFEGDDRILDGDDNGTATVDMGVDEVAVSGVCFRARLPMLLKGY